MLSDVKKFARDMVDAIDVSLDRVDRLDGPRRLILTSQLIGSIDTLSSLLVFFGRIAPRAARFAKGGRQKLARLRTDARRMRGEAFRELFQVEPPPDEESTDEQVQTAADAAQQQQPAPVIDVQPTE